MLVFLAIGLCLRASEPVEVDSETWEYFQEIALVSEYQEVRPVARKWMGPLWISTFGAPTESDVQALAEVVREVRALTGNRIRCFFVPAYQPHNVAIHFVPRKDFSLYAPQPSGEEVFGYFGLKVSEQFAIEAATLLIASDADLSSEVRSHMIREEFTQALGFLNDSTRYPDSIFQANWTTTQGYSERDRALIRMLYHPRVQPGDSAAQIFQAIHGGE